MQLRRLFSGVFVLVLASLCVCALPSIAKADDVNFTDTSVPLVIFNDSDDWSSISPYSTQPWIKRSLAIHNDTASSNLSYIAPNTSGKINTTSLGGTWLWYSSEYTSGNYSHPITGSMQFTGYVSNTQPLYFADISNRTVSGSYFYIGISFYGGYSANYQLYAPYFVRKGQKVKLVPTPKTMGTCSDDVGTGFKSLSQNVTNYFMYVKYGDNNVQVLPDSNGVYTIPYDSGYLFIGMKITNSSKFLDFMVMEPPDVILLDDTINQVVNNQTNQLMDTDGSNNIISGTDDVTNQIQSKLGFVSQSINMVNSVYDGIVNVEPANTVTFPALNWEGQTIIQQTDVPLLGWIPEIETPIKTMITGLLVFAWLSGVKKIYGRIFLGETDVISDED